MRNHVDDDIADQVLEHLDTKYGIVFKVYVFTANDLTRVPTKLIEQGLKGRCSGLTELCLSRNKLQSIDLKQILDAFP